MPYFKWIGVDIIGTIKKGKQVAHSSQDLSTKLLQQGIAMLRAQAMYTPLFLWPMNAKIKGDLFKQISKLLQAGLLLPKALEVIAQQSSHPMIHDTLYAIGYDVQQGVSFGKALEKHVLLCDPIIIIMLTAGHESGNLINAIENVALYFHKQHIFNKNIRSALAIPLLTSLFFIGISSFIFIFIIPRFADMFNSMQQDLPALTRSMVAISDFMRSFSMIYVALFSVGIIFCMYRYFTTAHGKKRWNTIIQYIPFIGTIMWQHYMCQVLQALALLVNSGMPLVDALKIVSDSIENDAVQFQVRNVCTEVASGQLLSSAMATTASFLPEVIALICVGEESGAVGHSLEGAALVYNDRVEESLRRFIFFLQPIVIIMLGLLVTTLIFAVYSPIMQLSYTL